MASLGEADARRATDADLPGVVATLAAAFAGDPVWGDWAFPSAADRVERLSRFWAPIVAGSLRNGGIWTTPAYEAVAVWVPPGVAELSEEDEEAVDAMLPEVCGDRAALVAEGFARFEASRPVASYWYLSLLGTHPDHRGGGLGMALVEHRLRAIDTAHEAAYLESTNPGNLPRYRKAGFERAGGFELPDGPAVDTMWRPAR